MKNIKTFYLKYIGIKIQKTKVTDGVDLIFSIHPFISITWIMAIYRHNHLKWYNPFRYQLKLQKPLINAS